MAEKVEKLGVHREKDFMYYVKEASVWRVQRKQPGVPKGRPEKVAAGSFKMDTDFIYFVDRDGDVSRADRAVGGQKRKKAPSASKAKVGKAKAKAKAKTKTKTAKASSSRSKTGAKTGPSRSAAARPKAKAATKSAAKSVKSRMAKKKPKK